MALPLQMGGAFSLRHVGSFLKAGEEGYCSAGAVCFDPNLCSISSNTFMMKKS
jgi:hypothetical protein